MTLPPADVLIVGSINVDLVARVERLPTAGETVTGGVFERHPGGKGANQAVAAARLGARVCFVGAVGYDDYGEQALDELRREGVDVSRVVRVEGLATGVALIVVDRAGENQIAVASGANAAVDGTLVESALADAPLAPGGVYLANLEVADEALLAGARLAAGRGLRIVINPAPARALDPGLL
ncbi:MAG TPA: PfkB family carbohydrate kinase, partial [Candidatus Limnocylindria bacterium]|nr:PfkB family carbohydrate kinase [Candidatus Limnocylindria bacterium]